MTPGARELGRSAGRFNLCLETNLSPTWCTNVSSGPVDLKGSGTTNRSVEWSEPHPGFSHIMGRGPLSGHTPCTHQDQGGELSQHGSAPGWTSAPENRRYQTVSKWGSATDRTRGSPGPGTWASVTRAHGLGVSAHETGRFVFVFDGNRLQSDMRVVSPASPLVDGSRQTSRAEQPFGLKRNLIA